MANEKEDVNQVRFRASPRIFRNSECVFVEYYDCVNLPWFTLLTFLQQSEMSQAQFDLDLIKGIGIDGLISFYFCRKNRNPMAELWKGDVIPLEELDAFLEEQMLSSNVFYDVRLESNVTILLAELIRNKLAQRIVIWSKTENPFIREDVKNTFQGQAEYLFGDFTEVLKKIPTDTLYIFSDVMHVLEMEEIERLPFSAIMLPEEYAYNFADVKERKYLVNMEEMEKKYPLKWASYRIT